MALYAALLWVSNDESCLERIDSLFKAHQRTVPLPTLRYALTDILGYDPVIPCAIMETGLRLYHHPRLEALVYPLEKGKVILREVQL